MEFYRFYFDDVLVEEPIDWKSFEIQFTESNIFPGIVFAQSIPSTFGGSSYDAILTAFEDAVCNSIDVRIDYYDGSGYDTLLNGIIFLSTVDIDYHKKTVNVEIKDNSFLAKIQNNKDIKFDVSVGRSKNDVSITPVTALDIDFFTPSTGTYDVSDVDCYDCHDVLEFLIAAMTDNTVTFESDYLDGLGLVFCTGEAIGDPAGNNYAPIISFKEAFEELYKKLNLSLIIESPFSTSPVIKIEPLNDNFVNEDSVVLDGVRLVNGSVDQDKYYASLKIGSTTFIEDASGFTFPSPRFLGARNEQYHLTGVCNSANDLDIVGQFVVDSNVIEDIIVNSSTSYDDNIFIIQTDRPTTDQATRYSDIVDYYYNKTLYNQAVAERFFGSIPNSIALFLGNGNDDFDALKDTDQTITVSTGGAFYTQEPVEYADEVSDPNANYDNANYYYTCPADGAYGFYASIRYVINGLVRSGAGVSETMTLKIELVRYEDNTFVTEIESIETSIIYSLDSGGDTLVAQGSLYLNTNNVVRVRVSANKIVSTDVSASSVEFILKKEDGYPVGSEPRFLCTANSNGGGIYQTYDEGDVRKILYSIEKYPITISNFKTIANNIGKRIEIQGTLNKKGWIKELVYTPYTGVTDLTIRGAD